MKKVFNFMRKLFAFVTIGVTLVCIDFPLKIVSFAILIVLGMLNVILFPITKHFLLPNWLQKWSDWTCSVEPLFACLILKLWE